MLAPPTAYTNITVLNTSELPVEVLASVQMLEKEYRDGYLTERGYLKRKAQLLEPFLNGATQGYLPGGTTPIPYTAASSPLPHGEVFQARRLQQVSEEEVELADYISEAKRKELRREGDMNRCGCGCGRGVVTLLSHFMCQELLHSGKRSMDHG